MASLELVLFGGFQARAAGHVIDVPGRKERALLSVLAMPPGEPRSREKLAGLLWSDRSDKQARDSLKQALLRLRKSFGCLYPLPMVTDRASVTLNRAEIAVDVQEFEQLVAEGTPDGLARATKFYRGDLLEGLDVRDPAFEEWLLFERQRLRDQARDALARLLAHHMVGGASDQAIVAARRLVALDPLHETAHRALMQIYAQQGQTALALKQYQLCCDALQGELGVKPEAETERLYQSIREKRRAGQMHTSPHGIAAETSSLLDAPLAASSRPTLPLPDKPSIAVLPFQNMSDELEQEYFADGVVQEIITTLSRFRQLFVIARNSSFTYKGRATDVKQVGHELGVRYVLEGSVRRASNRVRITAQLINATTGAYLWADRLEGTLEEIFDLQDRVAVTIVSAIAPMLEQAEIERARHKPTDSLDAYDCYMRGMASLYQWSSDSLGEALKLFYKAIELDPHFASAYGMAAWCYVRRLAEGAIIDRAEAERLARQAARLAKDDALALCVGGFALARFVGDHDAGISLIDRALTLNPNLSTAWFFSGWARMWSGEPELAIKHEEHAMRLSPIDPLCSVMWTAIAFAHFCAGRYAEACLWATKSLRETPNYLSALRIAAAGNALTGCLVEAQKAVMCIRQIAPTLRVSNVKDWASFRRPEDLARLEDGLRKAGLPE
jgi:TolB-like protein/DNA-binding SARP family transcriptional activator